MSNSDRTQVMGGQSGTIDRTMVVTPGGGMGATQQMPAGADAFRTQMGGTTTCPVCKSVTPLMDTYCGDCGFLLASTPAEELAVPEEQAAPAELVDLETGRRFRLRVGVNTLGRQGTDILVNDGTISRNHARLTVENGTVTVEDLGSSNGTKVGDLRLGPNQPTPASAGTPLRFGNWRVTLEVGGAGAGTAAAPAQPTIAMPTDNKTMVGAAFSDEVTFVGGTAPAEPASPTLTTTPPATEPVAELPSVALLRKTEGPANNIPVREGTLTIGRKPGNDLVLSQDAYLSGRHAEITHDYTGTYFTDLGSTNGTFVNGQKLAAHERQLLLEGDEIQLGQTKYRFELTQADGDTMEEQEAVGTEPPLDESENTLHSQWGQA